MIVDHISNWRRYGFGPAWEQMMCWLENYAPGGSGSLAGLKDGTHPLADGFVNVATLTSRPLSGTLNGAFDDQRDIGFFQPAPAEVSRVTLAPGTFALLFPWDAHLPAIAVDGVPAPLRKCVGKIPLEALRLS